MGTFALSPFLEALSASGVRVTVRDHERVGRILGCSGPLTIRDLRGALSALLVRDEHQERTFHRCFGEFFDLSLHDSASVDSGALLAELKGLLEVPPVIPDERPGTVRMSPLATGPARLPVEEFWPDTIRVPNEWTVLGTIGFELSYSDLPDDSDMLAPRAAGKRWDKGRSHFSMRNVGGQPCWLERETLDSLADSTGHFLSGVGGRRLDVPATIRATLRQGGIPELRFHRRRKPRRLLILEDQIAAGMKWNPLARELAGGFSQRGLEVTVGRFRGTPDRFMTPEGGEVHLEDYEDEREGVIVLLFTDGKALYRPECRFVFESLKCWPNLAWMDPREPRSWDASTHRPAQYGIPVYPASREGAIQAMRRFLTERGDSKEYSDEIQAGFEGKNRARWTRVRLEARVEMVLGGALTWAQECSLIQPVSRGLADKLRREFHPDLHPECIGRFHDLPGTQSPAGGLHFSTDVRRRLNDGFRIGRGKEEQQKVIEFILEEIDQVKPPEKESQEYLEWEWIRETLIRESTPPDQYDWEGTLRFLQTPLNPFVRSEFRAAHGSGGTPRPAGLHVPPASVWLKLTGRESGGEESDPPPQSVPPDMVLIKGGGFQMGDPFNVGEERERPLHPVQVSDFFLGQYQVTFELWQRVRAWALDNGYEIAEGSAKAGEHPVARVSWYDVVKWANARSEMEGRTPVYYLDDGYREVYRKRDNDLSESTVLWNADGYRLPTEAEWEKAARSGLKGHHYPWPSNDADFERMIDKEKAHYGTDSGRGSSKPVGSYPPSSFGLYDMSGNVYEWTWDRYGGDWYQNKKASQTDTKGPVKGTLRVIRGGAWNSCPRDLRCASRSLDLPSFAIDGVGFRLALGRFQEWSGAGGGGGARDEPSTSARASRTAGHISMEIDPARLARITLSHSTDEPRRIETSGEQMELAAGEWRMEVDIDGCRALEKPVPVEAGRMAHARVRPDPGRPVELTLIPQGSFVMGDPTEEGDGDERPVHEVEISAFYLDRYQVTLSFWKEIRTWALEHGYEFENEGAGQGPDHPVHNVSWYDVVKWANARSERAGREPVYYTNERHSKVYRKGEVDLAPGAVRWDADGFRLPTEAEWEKAARGGLAGNHYPWESRGSEHTNFINDSKAFYGKVKLETVTVASFDPNPYRLHDMAGNVYDWVWDWFRDEWYSNSDAVARDTRGPSEGAYRVVRGGAWNPSPRDLRCAFRGCSRPSLALDVVGFRLALGRFREWSGEGAGGGARDEPSASARASGTEAR